MVSSLAGGAARDDGRQSWCGGGGVGEGSCCADLADLPLRLVFIPPPTPPPTVHAAAVVGETIGMLLILIFSSFILRRPHRCSAVFVSVAAHPQTDYFPPHAFILSSSSLPLPPRRVLVFAVSGRRSFPAAS